MAWRRCAGPWVLVVSARSFRQLCSLLVRGAQGCACLLRFVVVSETEEGGVGLFVPRKERPGVAPTSDSPRTFVQCCKTLYALNLDLIRRSG